MSLSCHCGDFEAEPGDMYWLKPRDYQLHKGKRRVRCRSCGDPIAPGDTCTIWPTYKVPKTRVEIRIYGEDGGIKRAPFLHCERCADLFFSLNELGYCVDPHEDMRGLAKEYARLKKAERARQAGAQERQS